MATPIAVGDLLQARTVNYVGNQIGICIVHYEVTAIGGTPDLELLANTWDTTNAAAWKALISNQAKFRGTGFRRLTPNATIEYPYTGQDGAGTVVSDVLPHAIAGIITKVSGLPGRAFRGRMYLPFPGESANDTDGTPTNAYVGLLNSLAFSILRPGTYTTSLGNTVSMRPVIKHAGGFTSVVVATYNSRKKWATQHRRGDYGRPNVLPF